MDNKIIKTQKGVAAKYYAKNVIIGTTIIIKKTLT